MSGEDWEGGGERERVRIGEKELRKAATYSRLGCVERGLDTTVADAAIFNLRFKSYQCAVSHLSMMTGCVAI